MLYKAKVAFSSNLCVSCSVLCLSYRGKMSKLEPLSGRIKHWHVSETCCSFYYGGVYGRNRVKFQITIKHSIKYFSKIEVG